MKISPELHKLIDVLAEAGMEFRVAMFQADTAKLTTQLDVLEKTILEVHRIADTITEPLSDAIKIELRVCEMGLERLRAKAAGDPNWRERKPK